MKNEIMEEVWRNRDEFARQHNHDIDAMVAALRDMERKPLSQIVDRRRKAPNCHAGRRPEQRGANQWDTGSLPHSPAISSHRRTGQAGPFAMSRRSSPDCAPAGRKAPLTVYSAPARGPVRVEVDPKT